MNETRWPNTFPPHVQPYNDAVLADLENVMREVVALGDRLNITGVELIEIYRHVSFGDGDQATPVWVNDMDAILEPHTTSEFDVEDLTFELLELIGSPDDDSYSE